MYKVLNIGNKDYKLEYSIEASLYADCVSTLTGFFTDLGAAQGTKNVKQLLKGISNLPQTALTLFYAGLIEAHGTHPEGDKTVPDIHTAKNLIAQYFKEHAEDDQGNFYSVLEMCIKQMEEDGFFKLVGLNQMLEAGQQKTRKVPQDHLKASGK